MPGFLAACLLLVVASCLDGRSPTIDPTETSPTAPTGDTAMPATLRVAFLRAQQKADGYDFRSDAAGTLRGRAGARGATAAVAATARGVRLSRDDDGGLEAGGERTARDRGGLRGACAGGRGRPGAAARRGGPREGRLRRPRGGRCGGAGALGAYGGARGRRGAGDR